MNTVIPFFIWPFMYLVLGSNTEKQLKLTRNFIGFIDAFLCCMYSLLWVIYNNDGYYQLSIIIPITYYIWDSYLIIINKLHKENPYLYHHLVSIWVLTSLTDSISTFSSIMYSPLIFAELSNLPLYVTYYVIKSYPKLENNKPNINNIYIQLVTKTIQLFIYFVIRIGVFSYVIYTKFHILDINLLLKTCIFSIYLLGCIWLTTQIRLVYKDYNYYKMQLLELKDK
jgi:hypothetical protein